LEKSLQGAENWSKWVAGNSWCELDWKIGISQLVAATTRRRRGRSIWYLVGFRSHRDVAMCTGILWKIFIKCIGCAGGNE